MGKVEITTERMCKHCDHPEICHDTIGTFSKGECGLHVRPEKFHDFVPCACPGFEPAEGTAK